MKKLGNVYILGDSYSTFDDYTYTKDASYYPNIELDVKRVEQTWWHQLIEETDSKLIDNDSWSGSSVCNTGYEKEDCTHWSFVTRIEQYCEKNNTTDIDTVFVFGGTNDAWAGAPLGELKFDNITAEDKKNFIPAYSYMIQYIKSKFVNAKIYALINDKETISSKVIDGIKAICERLNVEYIQLENIKKDCGHPNVKGMTEIKNQILQYIK